MMREERKKWIVKMTTATINPVLRTCKCGSTNIRILKTNECGKCYQARRRAEKPEEFRARWRKDAAKAYVPAEKAHTAAVAPTTECTYDAAHRRVKRFRGAASTHICFCGSSAQEWSYRGGSEYEQTGIRLRWTRGVKTEVNSIWSRYIMDYDALCIKCHDIRDSK